LYLILQVLIVLLQLLVELLLLVLASQPVEPLASQLVELLVLSLRYRVLYMHCVHSVFYRRLLF